MVNDSVFYSLIRINSDSSEAQRREAARCSTLPGTFFTFLLLFDHIGSRSLQTQRVRMCSLIHRVKPAQRALAVSLRLKTNAEGLKHATAGNSRLCPAVSAATDPLRATSRSYCSRMASPRGLFFRQVGAHISTMLWVCLHACIWNMELVT